MKFSCYRHSGISHFANFSKRKECVQADNDILNFYWHFLGFTEHFASVYLENGIRFESGNKT